MYAKAARTIVHVDVHIIHVSLGFSLGGQNRVHLINTTLYITMSGILHVLHIHVCTCTCLVLITHIHCITGICQSKHNSTDTH